MKDFIQTSSTSMRNNDQGSAGVVLLFALLITILTVSAFYFSSANLWRRSSLSQSTSANIFLVQSSLLAILNDAEAWQKTFAADSTLKSCLTDASFSCPPGSYALALRNESNVVVFPAQQAYDTNGVFCSSYGSQTCPFYYGVNWSPQCPATGACSMPYITLTLSLKSVLKPAINTDTYFFQLGLN